MQDAVSIRLILPQRLRWDLNVSSSITPEAKMSSSQDSVSAHSFLAISNLECISARLCGYCASVIFAKTLDEDYLIWKTVLESILYASQSFTILIANSSPYSKSKFFFAIVVPPASYSITAKPCMESLAKASINQCAALHGIRNLLRHGIDTKCRMESRLWRAWHQDRRGREHTAWRLMPYARWAIPYNSQSELMPYQALRSWIKITAS